jgi:hypothetical protein
MQDISTYEESFCLIGEHMTAKHPYISSSGYLGQFISHSRKSFPSSVTVETLRKLGIAPKNESYIINILKYLGLIDQEGAKTDVATRIFSLHDDAAFATEFGKLVAEIYKDLFELHGDNTWNLDLDALINYFRASDSTSEVVGRYQALTFKKLVTFAGYGTISDPKVNVSKTPANGKKSSRKNEAKHSTQPTPQPQNHENTNYKTNNIGLTVRIEINLPSDGDKETYDRIFSSIRENLLNE